MALTELIKARVELSLKEKAIRDASARGMDLSEHIRDLLEFYKKDDDLPQKEKKVSKKPSKEVVKGSGWRARLEEQIREAKNKKDK